MRSMEMGHIMACCALVLVAWAATSSPSRAEDAADLILRDGRFYTVATPEVVEGSLAVRDGRIVYLGASDGADALVGPETEVIDLAGRAVTPGLIDAHSHLSGLGAALAQVDLVGAESYEEVIERVAAAAAKAPPGAWIRGRGWDQNDWPVKAFPSHAALSEAVADHPVWLTRVDGHAALLNVRALDLAGITAETADPPGGRIMRDQGRRPTGVLVDNAMDLAAQAIPARGVEEIVAAIERGARECNSVGLTTVTDMGVGDPTLRAYTTLADEDRLPLRVAAFLTDDDELLDRWFERGPLLSGSRFQVRGVKLYADGALGSRGAALIAPYSDEPEHSGLLITGSNRIADICARAKDSGFQVAVHAIGDRGNAEVLDAFERCFGGEPRPALRFRIEHAQVMRLADIERLARLRVIASMQPTHATSDMPWAEERVGKRRLAGAYAWRRVLESGGRLALGSDFPVESPDPRLGLYAAVTRQDRSGNPPGGWLPDQRLTRQEALRGFTLDAAWSLFLDHEVGSLEAGKRADLVVWGDDPMTVAPAAIPGAAIDMTLVDGEIVHRRREP
ncbi:MAG: amidohydrolase [Thermoanaerobaculia bacterium]